jgi:hypothetical protein
VFTSYGSSFDGVTRKRVVDKRPSKSTVGKENSEKVPVPVQGRGQSKDSFCGRTSRYTHDRGGGQDDRDHEGGSGGGHDMDDISVSSERKVMM